MDSLQLLQLAVDGWRATHDARFGAFAEFAAARALTATPRPLVGNGSKKADTEAWLELYQRHDLLDVSRLVAAVGGAKSPVAAERLLLLSKLNDPRVVRGTLRWLEQPPYRAKTATAFFRAAISLLSTSGELQLREVMLELSARYKGIIETSMGDEVAGWLRRAAEELDQVKPGPLPAKWAEALKTLSAVFDAEQQTSQRVSQGKALRTENDEGLLAAVYAAPDDDAPRWVLADALTERDDARGEFIALQLRHASGEATNESRRRERELLGDPKRRAQWGAPLSQAGHCFFSRGLPVRVVLQPKNAKAVVGLPAWKTVREVHVAGLAVSTGVALLTHEVMRHLDFVGGVSDKQMAELQGDFAWRGVSFAFGPTAAQLAQFPKLTRLEVSQLWGPPFPAALLAGLPQLEVYSGTVPSDVKAFSATPRLRQVTLDKVDAATLGPLLGGLEQLEALQVLFPSALGSPALPHLKKLHVRYDATLDLEALLRQLPSLEELVLEVGFNNPLVQQSVLRAAPHLHRVARVRFGELEWLKPFQPGSAVVVRSTLATPDVPRLAAMLQQLPREVAERVVLKPLSEDVHSTLPPLPPEATLTPLQRAAGERPFTVEWW